MTTALFGGLAFAIAAGSQPMSAQGYSSIGCPSGYTLERNSSNPNQYRCSKKLERQYAHVGCEVGWLHQALDGKDTCKGFDTSVNQSKLRCITLPGETGWLYQVMVGGDRCYRDRVDYAKPTI